MYVCMDVCMYVFMKKKTHKVTWRRVHSGVNVQFVFMQRSLSLYLLVKFVSRKIPSAKSKGSLSYNLLRFFPDASAWKSELKMKFHPALILMETSPQWG